MRIKDLPLAERPRERLLLCGVESLSVEELLSITIKTGTRKKSSKQLASEILSIFGIDGLREITVNGLCQIEGIGKYMNLTNNFLLIENKSVFTVYILIINKN